MISVRKLLAKLLLISLIFTNTGSYVFAEDAVLHSLDELPSVQVEATDLPVAAQASFSELLAEKSAFESTQYSAEEKTETTESLSIIGSALAKEHEMYVAQAMLAFTPSTTPTLTPTFITSPFVPS